MGSAHAYPLPANISLRLPVLAVFTGSGLRTAVAATALATLTVAGAATAFLLPQASAPPHTTVLTPVSTAAAPR